jgi:hypothetical protein
MDIDEQDLCLELFLDWLASTHASRFRVDQRPFDGLTARCTDGQRTLAVEVRPLLAAPGYEVWETYRRKLEGEIAVDLPGAFALWVPPGADLPGEGDSIEDFRQRVHETALTLQPGERGTLRLPVQLRLRKIDDEGGLMSVVGGLSRYWAGMSERVRGTFELDASAIHRLPESEEERVALVDRTVQEAGRLTELRQWVHLPAEDVWTIQRLRQGQGLLVVGLPPQALADIGIGVRRNLRRILTDAGPRLVGASADLKALLILGFYDSVEGENVSTSLRGFDPTLYTSLDFVCLAADGRLKPIVEPKTLGGRAAPPPRQT